MGKAMEPALKMTSSGEWVRIRGHLVSRRLQTYRYSRQMPWDILCQYRLRCCPDSGITYSACTLEFLTSRSHIHTMPLTPMVLSIMIRAGSFLELTVSKSTCKNRQQYHESAYNSTMSRSGDASRWIASRATCTNDVIIMMEKTKTPNGSSLPQTSVSVSYPHQKIALQDSPSPAHRVPVLIRLRD